LLRNSRTRSFADDEFRRHGKFRGIIPETLKPLEKDSSRGCAHFAQGLPHSGQPGIVISGKLNVVETHDGNVFGYPKIGIPQGTDGADRRNVVEGNDGSEMAAGLQE